MEHVKPPTPLKVAIIQSGRHQKDIAAAIGIDPTHLSRIANGLHASEATREALAAELGRTVDDLFSGTGGFEVAA